MDLVGSIRIPILGLGTWELKGKECTQIVKEALELGYRHIDTAHIYENHSAIQKAISHFDRKSFYLTSKLSLDQVDLGQVSRSVEEACDLALRELGIDELDLYLIHWADRSYPLVEIFKTMETLVQKGKIRHAGVSNFTIHHLEDLLKEGCKVEANQVEFHPYLYQKKLWDVCRKHQIELISYRSFGKGKLLGEPLFIEIGETHRKTPAQVLLRWLIQKGIPSIPKASKKSRLQENIEIFDFHLTDSEMSRLDHANRNKRFAMADEPEFDY